MILYPVDDSDVDLGGAREDSGDEQMEAGDESGTRVAEFSFARNANASFFVFFLSFERTLAMSRHNVFRVPRSNGGRH